MGDTELKLKSWVGAGDCRGTGTRTKEDREAGPGRGRKPGQLGFWILIFWGLPKPLGPPEKKMKNGLGLGLPRDPNVIWKGKRRWTRTQKNTYEPTTQKKHEATPQKNAPISSFESDDRKLMEKNYSFVL